MVRFMSKNAKNLRLWRQLSNLIFLSRWDIYSNSNVWNGLFGPKYVGKRFSVWKFLIVCNLILPLCLKMPQISKISKKSAIKMCRIPSKAKINIFCEKKILRRMYNQTVKNADSLNWIFFSDFSPFSKMYIVIFWEDFGAEV